MLIPYNTDAAIYHRPYATIGLIAANTLAFFGILTLYEVQPQIVEEMILHYGNGLRPWQWITSNFIHGGWLHLLGNMFCLWGFGLVVEGRIGWWRMLLVYFGIGVTQCAVEQSMMLLASEGGSFGASSIVYGLLAMCLVWSPENEMNCVLLLGPPRLFEAKLSAIASILFFIEIATGIISGMAISSQVLHLMGGAAGFGLGVVMLRQGWVDCEGWDLFSVLKGRPREQVEEDRDAVQRLLDEAHNRRLAALGNVESVKPAASSRAPAVASTTTTVAPSSITARPVAPAGRFVPASSNSTAAAQFTPSIVQPTPQPVDPQRQAIHAALRAGDPAAAYRAYQVFAADLLNWPPPELELLHIINAFQQQRRWSESVPPMVDYLECHTSKAAPIRLKLAHVLLEVERRPAQALQVLSKLKLGQLTPEQQETFNRLVAHARARKQTQPKEPPLEDW